MMKLSRRERTWMASGPCLALLVVLATGGTARATRPARRQGTSPGPGRLNTWDLENARNVTHQIVLMFIPSR